MHQCEALVISCIDFRFQEHLKEFLNKRHFQSYDLVCMAGGAKNFLQGSTLPVALNQVGLSFKLHQIKRVYLINHQNCGAYGANFESGSPQELVAHSEDLKKAGKVIKEALPNLEIHLYFMQFKKSPLAKVSFTVIK